MSENEKDDLDYKIDKELERWNQLGVPVSGFMPPRGVLDVMCLNESMAQLLVEKEILGEKELQDKFRQTLLEKLELIRKEIEPQVQEARREMIKTGKLGRMH